MKMTHSPPVSMMFCNDELTNKADLTAAGPNDDEGDDPEILA